MDNEDFGLGIAGNDPGKDTFQDSFKTNLGSNVLTEKENNHFSDIPPIGIFEDAFTLHKLTVGWESAFADVGINLDIGPKEESDVLSNDQNIEGKEEKEKEKNAMPVDRENLADNMDQRGRDDMSDLREEEKDDVEQKSAPGLIELPPTPKPMLDLTNEMPINEKLSGDDPNFSEEGVAIEVEDPDAEMLADADEQVWSQEEFNASLADSSLHLEEEKMEKPADPNADLVIREKQFLENVSLQHDAQPLEFKLTIISAEEVFEKIALETYVALNPTTNKTTVYFSKKGKKQLLLLDSTGNIFNQWLVEGTQFEMPLTGLTSGAYFLKVQTEVAIVTVLKLDVV